MIEGDVNAGLEAVISLTLQGPSGEQQRIEAVIDTGFGGQITIPRALATQLGLPFRGTGLTTLADGSVTAFEIFGAAVIWDGEPRRVEAEAAEVTPLVGMAMLEGQDLHVEVERGGRVIIERRT